MKAGFHDGNNSINLVINILCRFSLSEGARVIHLNFDSILLMKASRVGKKEGWEEEREREKEREREREREDGASARTRALVQMDKRQRCSTIVLA
jgi:hypothetical protein